MKIKPRTYTTKEIAVLTNVHPNTVRLYEKWGYISTAQRKQNNYRLFTAQHLYQMKLARVALPGPYPIDGKIVSGLVRQFAVGDIKDALKLSKEYLEKVEIEEKRAITALEILDKWFEKNVGDKNKIIMSTRKKAAYELGISVDTFYRGRKA